MKHRRRRRNPSVSVVAGEAVAAAISGATVFSLLRAITTTPTTSAILAGAVGATFGAAAVFTSRYERAGAIGAALGGFAQAALSVRDASILAGAVAAGAQAGAQQVTLISQDTQAP